MSSPNLYILTLSWNGLEKLNNLKPMLEANLDNLLNFKEIDSYWYIRDNGSKDNTIKEIETWDRVKAFDIGHNRHNFSQGVNYLFDQASPNDNDLILLLNNDVEFNDNSSLQKMIDLMTEDVGMVGARLLYPNKTLQHAGVIFSEQYGLMPYHYKHKMPNDVNAEKNRYFQAVTAACCLIKASEFRKYYLDEKLFWAFEDINLALNIGQNKKIAYCGGTNITHFESQSLKLNPVNKLFLNSNVALFKKNWFGKYKIDHQLYLDDQNFNLIK